MSIYENIEHLLAYGMNHELLTFEDVDYARNQLLDCLGLDEPRMNNQLVKQTPLSDILTSMLDWAAENGLLQANTITYRDLFDTKLMATLLPRPSTVIQSFYQTLQTYGPEEATATFYRFNQHANYIRSNRIALNESWSSSSTYGELEITINLSKPEIDPTAIAAAKHEVSSTYPNGLLAKENVGYVGRAGHPARQNLRIIPVTLGGQHWYLQFSPYVYYHEHAIVFSGKQVPMKISAKTFSRLFDFVSQFPHYFIGSNADLPIVGGSILKHDHYQGGTHTFPMAKAPLRFSFTLKETSSVKAGVVHWPMSVIRLQGANRNDIEKVAATILTQWQSYSDASAGIFAATNGEQHNTITPVARRSGDDYVLDLVLRNNRTTAEHPLGLFHPHAEVHSIKKENIGLIEVMGLAILPGRLKGELEEIAAILIDDNAASRLQASETIAKHADWALALKQIKGNTLTKENVSEILKEHVGKIFNTVLEHAGVFKDTQEGNDQFKQFILQLTGN
ncbi:UDP-glucose--hexose-1-phosphate uridylyltransferase [Shouchella patagoniensis]|uniref:UDP-glucose--hexose-1-phosphate uridylyltransferase n=1 Tax=Shouchella patagoniensis TaxID=228576 RepID=UPI000995496B|nr:UDP-glucose--hexose-1-phosphate uridylyltransferase [Shouchella patagoniensis]